MNKHTRFLIDNTKHHTKLKKKKVLFLLNLKNCLNDRKKQLKIKKQYLEKIKILKKYNESYYNKSNPIVTDSVYDHLKKEIFELEKKYSFF